MFLFSLYRIFDEHSRNWRKFTLQKHGIHRVLQKKKCCYDFVTQNAYSAFRHLSSSGFLRCREMSYNVWLLLLCQHEKMFMLANASHIIICVVTIRSTCGFISTDLNKHIGSQFSNLIHIDILHVTNERRRRKVGDDVKIKQFERSKQDKHWNRYWCNLKTNRKYNFQVRRDGNSRYRAEYHPHNVGTYLYEREYRIHDDTEVQLNDDCNVQIQRLLPDHLRLWLWHQLYGCLCVCWMHAVAIKNPFDS